MPVLRGLTDAEAQVLGLPSGTSEATNQGEKSLNGYTAGRWKHAKTYLLPPDPKNPGKLRYQMHIGRDVHYQDDGGNWRTIDLTWRADPTNSGEFVTDQNDIYTRVSRFGVAMWDRKRKIGLRWSTTVTPTISGNQASFPKDGLTWTWTPTTSGLKLESKPVAAPRGPQTYEWRYLVIDLNRTDGFNLLGTLSADAGGNLVGDGFVTPRAYAIGANGVQYDCGKWQVVPAKTRAVSFAFDDSTLPPEAFPYVIDPTTTFNVSVSADDGNMSSALATYPPAAPSSGAGDTTGTSINAQRDLQAGTYTVRVGLVRWDTSALPDTATVTGATLRGYVTLLANTDVRSLTADWYASSNWPIDYQDWILAAQTSAQAGLALSSFTLNADNDIPLANAAANVSLTSYTGLRLHISGGQPTGTNRFLISSFDNATVANRPRLIITYTDGAAPVPLDLGASSVAAASTTAATTALAQGITPVTTATGSTSIAMSQLLGLITQATATGTTVTTTSLVVGIASVAVAAVTSTADLTIASATITPLDMGVVAALGVSSTSVSLSIQMGLSVTVQMAGQETSSLRLLQGLIVAATAGSTTTSPLLQQMGLVPSTTAMVNTIATVSTFMGISANAIEQTTAVATLKQLLGLTAQTTTMISTSATLSQLVGLIATTITTSTTTADLTILSLTITPFNMGTVSAMVSATDATSLNLSMGLRPQLVTAMDSTAAGLIMNLGLSGQIVSSATTLSALPLLQGLTATTSIQDTTQATLRMMQGISGQTTANGSTNATLSQLMGLVIDALARGTASVSLAFMGEIIVLVVNISAMMPGTVTQMDQLPGTINLTLVIPNHVEVK